MPLISGLPKSGRRLSNAFGTPTSYSWRPSSQLRHENRALAQHELKSRSWHLRYAEIVEIELDVLRNRILRFELLLSISGFTVGLGALVTGEGHLYISTNSFWGSAHHKLYKHVY